MWILILTLINVWGQESTSMASVPGFQNVDSCRVAATEWVGRIEARENSSKHAIAVCVPTVVQ